jgi:hypothetical protein
VSTEPQPSPTHLQILATEHWSLLATRTMAWNEAFSRAGMFLSTLSGATVALALVAQASAFGRMFVLFALVILPIALFVGVATFLRLGASNYHDALCVAGMNRIRAAYLRFAPDLAPYFVMGTHDDVRGMRRTMAIPGTGDAAHMVAATPVVVAVLNSVLAGLIAALLAFALSGVQMVALGAGGVAFVASLALHTWYARHSIMSGRRDLPPVFPTPEGSA